MSTSNGLVVSTTNVTLLCLLHYIRRNQIPEVFKQLIYKLEVVAVAEFFILKDINGLYMTLPSDE